MTKIRAAITAVGHYVPETVLTNADMEKIVETNDEWIKSRTGISERRILTNGEPMSFMAVEAIKLLLERRKITADDIDLILVVLLIRYVVSINRMCDTDKIGASKVGI
jgi:3-oxoacyl-[acyl-carrier-protein] synthase-3